MFTNSELNLIDEITAKCHKLDNSKAWTKMDDLLERLDWLDNTETINEAYALIKKHAKGDPRCDLDHPKDNCLIPILVKAVESLLNHYVDDDDLTPNHRMILQYYLAFDCAGKIIY